MAADSIFIDTNILVFADLTGSPYYDIARKRLVSFHDAGHTLWISRQIIREYLVALTRGQSFSAPVSPQDAVAAARVIASQLRVASDTPEVGSRLLELIEQFSVMGKQVHDANIVATMLVNGVKKLFTHNVADFNRYGNLIEIIPLIP